MIPAAGCGRIDVNCDAGEDSEAIANGAQRALLGLVTSVNVACGGHAGDDATMNATVECAKELGVRIGAHPSYPDRLGFGRNSTAISVAELEESVAGQLVALGQIARAHGCVLSHVKPHGALYNDAARNPEIALSIALAAARVCPGVPIVGLAGSSTLMMLDGRGYRTASEAFADRVYEPDGSLRSRKLPGALITDPAAAAVQAVGLACGQGVRAHDGTIVPCRADTLCIHGDTPGAVLIARAVLAALRAAGAKVRALGG